MSREPLFTAEDIAKSLVPPKPTYQDYESEAWTLVMQGRGDPCDIDFVRLMDNFSNGMAVEEAARIELVEQGVIYE